MGEGLIMTKVNENYSEKDFMEFYAKLSMQIMGVANEAILYMQSDNKSQNKSLQNAIIKAENLILFEGSKIFTKEGDNNG